MTLDQGGRVCEDDDAAVAEDEADKMIQIVLHDLAGNSLEFEVEPDIDRIKDKVASSEWQIPSICQRLLAGSEVLDSTDQVLAHCQSDSRGGALSVQLVVSLEAVYRDLASKDAESRIAALRALGHWGLRDRDHAVPSVAACLRDRDWQVRSAALDALSQMVDKGDDSTISALVASLSDCCAEVRQKAIELVQRVAEQDDVRVISALRPGLSHWCSGVRMAARAALAHLAQNSDVTGFEEATSALPLRLGSGVPEVD